MEKFRVKNIENNGRDYLLCAKERLKEAKILLREGRFAGSVSRSYYAFLDAATAILLTKNLVPRTHKGVIELFSLHFIKQGLVEKKFIGWFKRIKKDREDADYKHRRSFTAEEAGETLSEAEEFVQVMQGLFSRLVKNGG